MHGTGHSQGPRHLISIVSKETTSGFFCLASCTFRKVELESERVTGWIEEEWRPVHGANSTTPARQRRFVSTPAKGQVIMFGQSSGTLPDLPIVKWLYGIWLIIHQAEDGHSCSHYLRRSLKMFPTVSRDRQQQFCRTACSRILHCVRELLLRPQLVVSRGASRLSGRLVRDNGLRCSYVASG